MADTAAEGLAHMESAEAENAGDVEEEAASTDSACNVGEDAASTEPEAVSVKCVLLDIGK